MDKFINIITYTLGFLFFLQGALWVLSPVDAAAGLGMTLLTDKGLSTQIGDFTSFFFVVGIFTLIGAYTKESTWFYAPIALLGFAAIFRTSNVHLGTVKSIIKLAFLKTSSNLSRKLCFTIIPLTVEVFTIL